MLLDGIQAKISLISFRHFPNEEIHCDLSLGMCRLLQLFV